jgi:hypothetical protein
MVHVGDHQVPARAQDPGELGHHRGELRKMGQGQGAYDDVDVVVAQRQLVQVAALEFGLWHTRAGAGEHVWRAVDADDPVALRRQVLGVSAGAAGGVQGDAGR